MFEWIVKVLQRKKQLPQRIVLKDDGFDLYKGDALVGGVIWREVDKIAVYKLDLIVHDLICMELIIGANVFKIHEEVNGFWEIVKRIKEVFLTSQQNWEDIVVKPAFAQNFTVIYERPLSQGA